MPIIINDVMHSKIKVCLCLTFVSVVMALDVLHLMSDTLLSRNVEALSRDEGGSVLVPCNPSVSVCWFIAMDADGNVHNMSVGGLKNAF